MFSKFNHGSKRARQNLAATVAAVSVAWLGQTGVAYGKDIVIAQIAPQTGVQASAGKAYTAGLRLGFESVNAAGGINGSQIRLVTLDDGYRTKRFAWQKKSLPKKAPWHLPQRSAPQMLKRSSNRACYPKRVCHSLARVQGQTASLASPESF